MRGSRREARCIVALRAGPLIRRFAPPSPTRGEGRLGGLERRGYRRETACAGGGDRRGRGRRLDALPSRQEGLDGQRSRRAQGADLRLDLACGGPTAAVQPQLFGRTDPQIFPRALQDARKGDGPRRRPAPGVEHPPRPHPRPDGRVSLLRRRRGDDRRRGEVPDAARSQGHLAALQRRGDHRRDPAPRGRLYPARRPDPGAGARGARTRRRDQPP